MLGPLRRTLGRFARRTLGKFKSTLRFHAKREKLLGGELPLRSKKGWRGFFLATSLLTPAYYNERQNQTSLRDLGIDITKKEVIFGTRQPSPSQRNRPRSQPSWNWRVRGKKFFGGKWRLFGLAQLGMFAAEYSKHGEPEQRQPFRNLNDIFNLRDESEEKPRSLGGDDRQPKPSELLTAETKEAKAEDAKTKNYFDDKVTSTGVLVLKAEDIVTGRWEALSLYLKSTPAVKILRLQGVEITSKELKIIGESLKEIRHITFCDNSLGLTQGAVEILCATLLCCSFLESTSIIRNSLKDEHVPHIIKLISNHSSLKELSLCWNGIGDKGALQLARTLKEMTQAVGMSLRLLDLSYNRIGCVGGRELECSRYWNNVYGEPLCVFWKKKSRSNCRFQVRG